MHYTLHGGPATTLSSAARCHHAHHPSSHVCMRNALAAGCSCLPGTKRRHTLIVAILLLRWHSAYTRMCPESVSLQRMHNSPGEQQMRGCALPLTADTKKTMHTTHVADPLCVGAALTVLSSFLMQVGLARLALAVRGLPPARAIRHAVNTKNTNLATCLSVLHSLAL